MNTKLTIALLIAVVLSSVASITAQPSGAGLSGEEKKKLVDFHNKVRQEVGVGKIVWSDELAEFAQEWADQIARSGNWEHRPRDGKWASSYGENLGAGYGAGFDATAAAEEWYGEKKMFPLGATFSNATIAAGHYTQMVWRDSTQMGAASAVIQKGDYKNWTVIICNYNPAGNRIGEKPY